MRAEQVGVLPKCLLPGRTPRFRQALLFPSYTRFFAHSFDYHLVPCPHFLGGMGWPLPPAFSREMLPPAERRSAFKEQPLRTAEPRIMLGGWESTQQLPKPSPAQPSARCPRAPSNAPHPATAEQGQRGGGTAPHSELHPTSPPHPALALHIHEAAAPDWRSRAPAASYWPAPPPFVQPHLLTPAVTHQGVEPVPQRSPRPPPSAGRGAAPAPRSLFRPLQAPWTS